MDLCINGPNPFSLSQDQTTDIIYGLGKPALDIEIIIFNLLGEPLFVFDGDLIALAGGLEVGQHRVSWDGTIKGGEVGVGIYVAGIFIKWENGNSSKAFSNVAVTP